MNVYGVDEFDDAVGLRMELVDGLTLKQTLQQRGVFGAPRRPSSARICAAAAAHKAGLVHRDIKAQNVMREAGGRIVLMDFGAGEGASGRSIAAPDWHTLYLAPEVLGGQPATAVSDIYSIGVLLYHLLTMRYPVEGSTIAELERARQPSRHADQRSAAGPACRRRSGDRAGARSDPARRPRSAGAMQQNCWPRLLRPRLPAIRTARSRLPSDSWRT